MNKLKHSLLPLSVALGIVGCSGGNAPEARFTVQTTNLTYSQPFSPAAIVLHGNGYNAFTDGVRASEELEQLAEGGNPDPLIAAASNASQTRVSVRGAGVPQRSIGNTETLTVPTSALSDLRLTLVTMLVDTNDAFTGVNAVDISSMAVGASRTFIAPSWDSGTEANTETADTMPGPAAQGANGAAEGFNSARDDLIDRVHFHPGVVTSANSNDPSAEGLSTSVLTEGDRWDNPTARIVITRTQ